MDADEALAKLSGYEIHGGRLVVEFARGPGNGPGAGRRERVPGCFKCGSMSHFARDCSSGFYGGAPRDRGDYYGREGGMDRRRGDDYRGGGGDYYRGGGGGRDYYDERRDRRPYRPRSRSPDRGRDQRYTSPCHPWSWNLYAFVLVGATELTIAVAGARGGVRSLTGVDLRAMIVAPSMARKTCRLPAMTIHEQILVDRLLEGVAMTIAHTISIFQVFLVIAFLDLDAT